MDQGAAAVLGAIVGAGGAALAALMTTRGLRWQTREQARTAHTQWRRQVRRETYLTFISAAQRLSPDNALLRAVFNGQRAPAAGAFTTEWKEELHVGRIHLIRCAQAVDLEGPRRPCPPCARGSTCRGQGAFRFRGGWRRADAALALRPARRLGSASPGGGRGASRTDPNRLGCATRSRSGGGWVRCSSSAPSSCGPSR